MVISKKIHKIIGLAVGLFLFILSFTGFFLDHDDFNFLWNIKISPSLLSEEVLKKQTQSFEAYKINPKNPSHIIIGARQGIFVSSDSGKTFSNTLEEQVFSIEPSRKNFVENFDSLYIATSNGIYFSNDKGFTWQLFALKENLINAISVWNNNLYAVTNKTEIYKINLLTKKIESLNWNPIQYRELPKEITLSRLIRDLHYGRGLFDGKLSLYINDFATIVLTLLIITGFWFYFKFKKLKLRKKVNKKYLKFLILQHSSLPVLLTFIPIFLLLITGVFLDHSKFFNPFLKSTKLEIKYLPPVYKNLTSDIWGIDFDGNKFRLGNRLGVFSSNNLKNWKLDSKGFAYRIKRIEDELYISGMGSPNRVLKNNKWIELKNTVHMPRDFFKLNNKIHFVNLRTKNSFPVPKLHNIPLAILFLALHDGDFFHPDWVFVNDLVVLLVIILFITGFIRWKQSRRHKFLKYIKNKILPKD